MTPALEVRDLFRVHSTPEGDAAALQGLSLNARTGEIVTILGPSGAGKTTLLRIIAGLDRPSSGTVRVFGLDVGRLGGRALVRYRASTLGYVDQHYSRALAPELSARELVALRLRLDGVPRGERLRRADELLERVGLAGKAFARPDSLSGGEQQRVAVCAALAHRPRLLLADEPTGELDAASAGVVYAAITELSREQGCTAILVSHDAASSAIADRTVRIRDGRVSEESLLRESDEELIVVGRGGWVRLPEELLHRAGIGPHASAAVDGRGIVLTAVASSKEEEEARQSDSALNLFAAVQRDTSARGSVAEAHRLAKTYGRGKTAVKAIVDVSASFKPGRFYTITGPSGSGKTTLLQLLAGLELPTAGEVRIVGRSLATLDREARAALRREHVAVVGQASGLIGFLSAIENLELARAVRDLEPEPGRATEALAAVGLADRSRQRVSRLSSGEQARVAIGRALVVEPALLVADEPTSRLDQANALAMAILLRRLASEWGITVICATHDPVVIEQSDSEVALALVDPEGGHSIRRPPP
jgi:ABC-type lipoprotein export system ATPase subunit